MARLFNHSLVTRLGKIILLLVSLTSAQSIAQTNQVLHIIVPFPPGGGVDVVARTVAHRLANDTGRPIVVENRPGASGNIGADSVAKALPDGNTLLFSASTFIVNPLVAGQRMLFDPMTNFTHIALVAKGPVVLIANPSYGTTLLEFVKGARTNPDKYNLATGGYGSAGHLAGESFKLRAGLKIPVVLYKGTAPAFADLMGGQISGLFDPLVTALPLAKGGKVRALAIAASNRSPLAPDVPTMTEAGMPGFEFYTWYGIWAPAHLSDAISHNLELAINKAGTSKQLKTWFASQGLEFGNKTGAAFIDFEHHEQAIVEDIIKRGNLSRPQ